MTLRNAMFASAGRKLTPISDSKRSGGLLRASRRPGLTLPDTLDPLVVDYPARLAQERGDLAVAIAAVLPGKLDNIGCETLLVVTTARDLALRRAMLPERRTGATLAPARCRHGDARGLEVSPGSLLQDELIQLPQVGPLQWGRIRQIG